MQYGLSIWDMVYRYGYLPYRYGHPGYRYGATVISHIDMGYLVTLLRARSVKFHPTFCVETASRAARVVAPLASSTCAPLSCTEPDCERLIDILLFFVTLFYICAEKTCVN